MRSSAATARLSLHLIPRESPFLRRPTEGEPLLEPSSPVLLSKTNEVKVLLFRVCHAFATQWSWADAPRKDC